MASYKHVNLDYVSLLLDHLSNHYVSSSTDTPNCLLLMHVFPKRLVIALTANLDYRLGEHTCTFYYWQTKSILNWYPIVWSYPIAASLNTSVNPFVCRIKCTIILPHTFFTYQEMGDQYKGFKILSVNTDYCHVGKTFLGSLAAINTKHITLYRGLKM